MATPAATGIELVTSGMSDTEVPRQATSDPLPLCVTTGMRTPSVHDDDEVFTRTPLVPTVAGGVKGERVETNPPRGAGVQCKE